MTIFLAYVSHKNSYQTNRQCIGAFSSRERAITALAQADPADCGDDAIEEHILDGHPNGREVLAKMHTVAIGLRQYTSTNLGPKYEWREAGAGPAIEEEWMEICEVCQTCVIASSPVSTEDAFAIARQYRNAWLHSQGIRQ